MIIFGGFGNNEGVVYALDLTTMYWSNINNVQYRRYGHTANLIGNSIYLFGGEDNDGYYNDLHKYDVNSKTLTIAITSGNIPSARAYHGSAVIEEKLCIFGGNGREAKKDNTLYSLNTISSEWLAIPITKSSGSLPQPRSHMSMFSFESQLYLFGGYNYA